MKKGIIYIVIILLIAGIVLITGVKSFLQEQFFPVATIENAVTIPAEDYDIELQGINVPDSNLKNFKDKTVFLNFWGTWCPPCRKEWPTIQKLYEGRKDKVDFVLIAMNDQEDAVKKFLKENNYSVPVYIAQSPISEKLLPKVFPTTYLLGKNGRILMKEDASKDWNTESVHRFIDTVTQ
ncbi:MULTISPECIES: TlpA family protein disulfide reductase [Chryseobacterium]|uniref:Thiol-disulfide isomerase/thioredoxin n=1 Tax=Chryseobacterium camelliae TaxID=1265445 RepID=A0ABU0TKA4_9FLAO|nr:MULTISPECIES: TlpA disulfide reductase family protein [Chryseobacterium]MDT3408666.1 thiol-disulfide isomerase/thioredoxin [Pseudacidovorax intermedius]MDQ1097479.1 thiol-disulfide isomerase/thioredoxin [Chryseobacterium camelliae]MDQ1101408.1 thiol-disulfide isomerase/thioredoxin [Chryseobacterium sp. SORGH_AS_1048]MDR6084852.1 thiol-disulfide isomerase/thioredoxin [Chryseobacterium sp. SORGH_AS_0909]MDR6129203.1 thiol-disulfide isomerase/thioredoxin [Chryseobacterium sp. SORGH_AS_1175]